MEHKFSFKRLLSLLVVFTMLFSSFAMFAIPAGAEVFWAEGDYTIAENGNYSASHAYGYVFNVKAVNGTIAGEDAVVITNNAAYEASNPKWAAHVLFAPTEDANVYEIIKAIPYAGNAGAQGGYDQGINFENGNILLLVHSSASYPAYEADGVTLKYANWQSKVAAIALANTIGAKATLAGIDLEAGTVDNATVTIQDAPAAEEPEDVGPYNYGLNIELSDNETLVIDEADAIELLTDGDWDLDAEGWGGTHDGVVLVQNRNATDKDASGKANFIWKFEGTPDPYNTIKFGLYTDVNYMIGYPTEEDVYFSDDGENWVSGYYDLGYGETIPDAYTTLDGAEPTAPGTVVAEIRLENPQTYKYVKIEFYYPKSPFAEKPRWEFFGLTEVFDFSYVEPSSLITDFNASEYWESRYGRGAGSFAFTNSAAYDLAYDNFIGNKYTQLAFAPVEGAENVYELVTKATGENAVEFPANGFVWVAYNAPEAGSPCAAANDLFATMTIGETYEFIGIDFENGFGEKDAEVKKWEAPVEPEEPTPEETTNLIAGMKDLAPFAGNSSYIGDLTDGVTPTKLDGNNGEWFAFYNQPTYPENVNAPDGLGTIFIDLGEEKLLTEIKILTFLNSKWGINAPTSIEVFSSKTGEDGDWTAAGDIAYGELIEEAAWGVSTINAQARYVKVEVTLNGVFAMLSEVELYGSDVPEEEPTPEEPTPEEPAEQHDILVSHVNAYTWGVFNAMVITGEGKNCESVVGYKCEWWIAIKVDNVDGELTVTAIEPNDGVAKANTASADGFILYVFSNDAASFAAAGLVEVGDVLLSVDFDWTKGAASETPIGTMSFGPAAESEEPTPEEPESTNVLLGVAFDKLTGTYYSYGSASTDGSELTDGYYITADNLTGSLYADDNVAGFGGLSGSTLELEGALDATYAIDKIVVYYANGKTGSGICEPATIKAFYKNGEGEWIQFGTTFESTETDDNMGTRYDFLISSVEFTVDTAVEATDIRFELTPRTGKTMVFISELEAWGTEVTAEPEPEVPALPEGAIALDYAGYVHDSFFEILAGDNKTVADLTALGIGEAKDMNYFYLAVVDADNVITEMYTTLGRPDGVKSDVVCPEGGYIIGLNANKAGADALLAAKVGDSITLYNIDVDSFRGAEGSIKLVNAGFAIVPAAVEPEPEQTITQWGSGAGVEVMTDYYTGVDEINTYDGFQDKLYGFGNSALEAGEYSFDLTVEESTYNTITLYALDFAAGAVMLPEAVTFVIDGVEYEATINSNEGGIATIVATFNASLTATEITVKVVMGASPYTFGVFNMYTEIETSFVLPEFPENITQWGAGADIEVMTDGYNGVGEVNNYDGFQDKLYGLSNAVLDATTYSFDIYVEGAYFNGITLYALDFANGGVMLPEAVYFVIDNVYYEATITPNAAGIATITAELDEAITAYGVTVVVEMGASPYTFPIFNMYTEIEFTYEAPGLPENITQWGAGAGVEVMTDGYNGVGEVNNYDGFQDKLYGFGNANLDPATYSFDLTFAETAFDTITLYFLDFANGGVMVPEAVKFVVNGVAYDAVITENANGIGTIVAELYSEITASEITVVVDMAASPYSFGIFNMFTEIELTKFVPADPIDITLVEGENNITVPAGSSANATTNFDKDYVITIAGQWGVTVFVNGVEYYPNRMGNLEAPLPAGENTVEFKNSAEEPAEIVAIVAAPIVGDTMDDPMILDEAGDYTASVDANYPQGVFYSYIATADGTLTLTITSEGGWTYVINNITAGIYGDTQWSDSDPVAPSTTINVSAGDEIAFIVSTYDPENPWNAPAGEVTFTLTEGSGEEETETVEVALGDVNMDGAIDQFDYILIKRAYFETIELNDAQKELADVNADGVIDQFDYILVKRHYFETFKIEGVVEVPAELIPAE